MTRKVEIGAPSLTGKDANESTAKEFSKAKYPLKLTATNLMPRDVAFPEVEGLFLRHAGNEVERCAHWRHPDPSGGRPRARSRPVRTPHRRA